MKNPIKSEASDSLGLLLVRITMGAFLLLNGVAKLRMGVDTFVSRFSGSIPSWMPANLGSSYLHAVPFAEIVVGAMVILGLFARLAGLIGTLMLISFTIAVTGIKDPSFPFSPNLIYITVFLLVFLAGPGRYSLDARLLAGRRAKVSEPRV